MSNDKPTKRIKIAVSKKEGKVDLSFLLATTLCVPRVASYCDNEELLVLRRTSKAWKATADQEVMDRSKEILKKLPTGYQHMGYRKQHFIRKFWIKNSWTDTFASREAMAKAAVESARPLYDCLEMKSDGTFDKEGVKQRILESDTGGASGVRTIQGDDETGKLAWSMRIHKNETSELVVEQYPSWESLKEDYISGFLYSTEPGASNIPAEFKRLLSDFKILMMPAAQTFFKWKVRKAQFGFEYAYKSNSRNVHASYDMDALGQFWAMQFEGTLSISCACEDQGQNEEVERFQLEGWHMRNSEIPVRGYL